MCALITAVETKIYALLLEFYTSGMNVLEVDISF